MNLVDGVVIVLAALSALRGWRLGLLGQVFELGGGFLGLIAGVALGPRIASAFTQEAGLQRALISLIIVFIAMSVGQTVGHLLGRKGHAMADRARLGNVNSGLGAGFGVVVTIVSFWLIGSLLVHGPSRSIARPFRESRLLELTNAALPPPPNLLAQFTQYLNTSGFPQVFAGLPPELGEPVKLPSRRQAREVVEEVQDSVVQISVPACGGRQLGSGWIAAPSTVVTNAHVVSGGDDVLVRELEGAELSGRVVVFDPKTDLAVIHVEGLTGSPLDLDTRTLDRGTSGASLGYPGNAGGRLITHAAAVAAYYDNANGRDIYGRSDVSRDVYAIRSPVRQGDSGGPFVTFDGRVAAVVFAASTTDGDTGYALTGREVADDIQRGRSRTEAVGTGGCTN
ncbi:MAG TPA: MarP family serine protease [Actinomycetota bacterium]|nr:MarP family serine protease [Actinomycetota bacterium]